MDTRLHFTEPVSSVSKKDCAELIAIALEEDAPQGDVTSEAIFDETQEAKAKIMAKEDGIICGLSLLPILFQIYEKKNSKLIRFDSLFQDGQKIQKGECVLTLSGNLRALLCLERIILNFLQYLSGISTQVANAVAISGPGISVLDTRKTLPGFRRLAKYAVFCGGGTNHRIHLSDMAMIKDNHIIAAGNIQKAVEAVRVKNPNVRIEVEVSSLEQLRKSLGLGVHIILLDNMNREEIISAKKMIDNYFYMGDNKGVKPFLEISGNWTLERLTELSGLEKIGVSMGALTHTTRFLDLSMSIL